MKKRTIAILVGMMCLTAPSVYAQKNLVKGLTGALSSKAPAAVTSAVSAQVERQIARATLGAQLTPYASAANIPTATAVLSLERVKAEALHPQMDISKLVPVRLTDRADLVNRSLLRVQQNIQQDGKIPTSYRGHIPDVKVTWLAYHRLLLEDRKGNLSPEEQIQLRSLFWHTNTSISSVERKLQSWQDRYGADPMLPNKEDLDYLSGVNKPPYGNAFEEWALAADIYMLQKLYGTSLPKRIRNAQVLPQQELQNAKTTAQSKKNPSSVIGNTALMDELFNIAEANSIEAYSAGWDVATIVGIFDETDKEIFINKAQTYKNAGQFPTYKEAWAHFKEKLVPQWQLERLEIYLQKSSVLPQVFEQRQQLQNEALHPQMEAKADFQQLLKREQESIEKDRANGLFDYYWSKVEIADVVYKDTDKLARMVKAFYFYYIDPQLKVFPRAKYLKTNEAGRIYEIPLKRGLFLEVPGPLNRIPITPEEYVVFKADGENENPHLVKRADVELLTDPLSYKLNL